MRRKSKHFLEALVLLITVLAFNSVLLNTNNSGYADIEDFYAVSEEVSLDVMIDVANLYNYIIYLPSELPDDLELITIYLKKSSFIAIIVYSVEGNKDYKTAELSIEISPSNNPPTYDELVSQTEDFEYETVLEINNWLVLVNEKAYAGIQEMKEKYGEYILLVTVWICGMRYLVRCPTIIFSQAMQLVENMRLVTN